MPLIGYNYKIFPFCSNMVLNLSVCWICSVQTLIHCFWNPLWACFPCLCFSDRSMSKVQLSFSLLSEAFLDHVRQKLSQCSKNCQWHLIHQWVCTILCGLTWLLVSWQVCVLSDRFQETWTTFLLLPIFHSVYCWYHLKSIQLLLSSSMETSG
jgi:hypothetical protein